MGFLHFIREVGKHITVNYMMAKDSVKNRLETASVLHGVQLPAGARL
jgi:tyrosyl-tRNA synthetase